MAGAAVAGAAVAGAAVAGAAVAGAAVAGAAVAGAAVAGSAVAGSAVASTAVAGAAGSAGATPEPIMPHPSSLFVRSAQAELVVSDNGLTTVLASAYRIEEAFSMPLPTLFATRLRSPYRLRNDSGVELRFARVGGPRRGRMLHTVAPGEELPLLLWRGDHADGGGLRAPGAPGQSGGITGAVAGGHAITIEALGCLRTMRRVPVSHLGASVVPLLDHDEGGGGGGRGLVGEQNALVCNVDVCEQGAATLLRVSTLVQLRNETRVPVSVSLTPTFHSSHRIFPFVTRRSLIQVRVISNESDEGAAPSPPGFVRSPAAASRSHERGLELGILLGGQSISVPLDLLLGGLLFLPRPDLARLSGELVPVLPRSEVSSRSGAESPCSDSAEGTAEVAVVLGGGGGIEPATHFLWSDVEEALWLPRLLSVKPKDAHQSIGQRARRVFGLPNSEFLLEHYRCRFRPADDTQRSSMGRISGRISGRLFRSGSSSRRLLVGGASSRIITRRPHISPPSPRRGKSDTSIGVSDPPTPMHAHRKSLITFSNMTADGAAAAPSDAIARSASGMGILPLSRDVRPRPHEVRGGGGSGVGRKVSLVCTRTAPTLALGGIKQLRGSMPKLFSDEPDGAMRGQWRHKGRLYITSASIGCHSPAGGLKQLVPLASVTQLELRPRGNVLLAWDGGQLMLSMGEQTQRIFRALERHVARHSAKAVRCSMLCDQLLERYGLCESERLIHEFWCLHKSRHTASANGYGRVTRGKLLLFGCHLVFHGRRLSGEEVLKRWPLLSFVSIERQLGHFARASGEITIATSASEQLRFAGLWRPVEALLRIRAACEALREREFGEVGESRAPEPPPAVVSRDFDPLREPNDPLGRGHPLELLEGGGCKGGGGGKRKGGGTGADEPPLVIQCTPVDNELQSHAALLSLATAVSAARSAAMAATAAMARTPPPFFMCVSLERQRVVGAQTASGVPLRPLLIALETPLLLENALPVSLAWTLRASPANGWAGGAGGAREARPATWGRVVLKEEGAASEELASGVLSSGAAAACHAASPIQEWILDFVVEGYLPFSLLLNPVHEPGHGGLRAPRAAKLPDHCQLVSRISGRPSLRLMVENKRGSSGSRTVTLYAPYWLLNATGLSLVFREVRVMRSGRKHLCEDESGRDAASARSARSARSACGALSLRATAGGDARTDTGVVAAAAAAETGSVGSAAATDADEDAASGSAEPISEGAEPSALATTPSDAKGDDMTSAGSFPSIAATASGLIEDLNEIEGGDGDGDGGDAGALGEISEAEATLEGDGDGIEGAPQPILFSYIGKHDLFAQRVRICVLLPSAGDVAPVKTAWSKPFSLDALDTVGTLRVGPYEFATAIKRAPGCALTKTITLAPRYILQNRLSGLGLCCRQLGVSEWVRTLPPLSETSFNWPSATAAKREEGALLQLALADGGSREVSGWSGHLRIDEMGEFTVRCGTARVTLEVVQENQRRLSPFHEWSANSLLATDFHGPWSDESLSQRYVSLGAASVLPAGWEWQEGGWSLDRTPRDRDGWEYATNWPDAKTGDTTRACGVTGFHWHAEPSTVSLVRRRRWLRHRQLVDATAAAKPAALVERFLHVEVSLREPSVVVRVSDGDALPPPYLLHNESASPVVIYQHGAPLCRRLLAPGMAMPYAWDLPAGKRLLVLRFAQPDYARLELKLDEVGEYAETVTVSEEELTLHVALCGETRVVRVAPKGRGVRKRGLVGGGGGCMEGSEGGDGAKRVGGGGGGGGALSLIARLEGIGISLVRSGAQELAYLRTTGVRLGLERTVDATVKLALEIDEIRLDNQILFPNPPANHVVLIRSSLLTRTGRVLGSGAGACAAAAAAAEGSAAGIGSAGGVGAEGGASSGAGGSAATTPRQRAPRRPCLQLEVEEKAPHALGGRSFGRFAFTLDEIDLNLEEAFLQQLYYWAAQLENCLPPTAAELASVSSATRVALGGSAGIADAAAAAEGGSGGSKRSPARTATELDWREVALRESANSGVGAPDKASEKAPDKALREPGGRRKRAVKWYLDQALVAPIRINISFSQTQASSWLQRHFSIPNLVIPNLDRAPLVLEKLVLQASLISYPFYMSLLCIPTHITESFSQFHNQDHHVAPAVLYEDVRRAYMGQLLRQLYRLVLQIESIGNLPGFARSLGAGMRDFVMLPAKGLLESPENFGAGLVQGAYSLTGSVVGGLSKTFSQVTGGLGRACAQLSMDDDYLKLRDRSANAPRHAVDGVASGAACAARGLAQGLAGLIAAPLEGAQSRGLRGFVSGMGKGVVGAAVKPAVGLLDFASRAFEGVNNTFDFFEQSGGGPADDADGQTRMRMARMLHGPERALRPYSAHEAIAQRVMLGLRDGAVYLRERLLFSVRLATPEVRPLPRLPLTAPP